MSEKEALILSSSPLPLAGEVGARSVTGGGASPKAKSPLPCPPPQAGEGKNASHSIQWRTSSKMRKNARRLRRDMTDAERAIWKELRAHRLNGTSFRRQKPVGPYIVDFVCEAARLVIEIDGGQHYEAEGVKNDARRNSYLKFEGYDVLRFSNADVLTNMPGVLETILTSLRKSPLPASPASGGGEGTGGDIP